MANKKKVHAYTEEFFENRIQLSQSEVGNILDRMLRNEPDEHLWDTF